MQSDVMKLIFLAKIDPFLNDDIINKIRGAHLAVPAPGVIAPPSRMLQAFLAGPLCSAASFHKSTFHDFRGDRCNNALAVLWLSEQSASRCLWCDSSW